jgi:hypothetical protein
MAKDSMAATSSVSIKAEPDQQVFEIANRDVRQGSGLNPPQ